MARNNDDHCFRVGFPYQLQHFKTVHLGHPYIEKDNPGFFLFENGQSFFAVFGGADGESFIDQD